MLLLREREREKQEDDFINNQNKIKGGFGCSLLAWMLSKNSVIYILQENGLVEAIPLYFENDEILQGYIPREQFV